MPRSYDQWMKEVDKEVQRRVGLSVHDLTDFCSRDLFDSDVSPEEAAEEAIENDDVASMLAGLED